MYGVPVDLPLQRFVGDALFQVCLGMDGVHFTFGRAGTISVEGTWVLSDASGKVVDQSMEYAERESYRLHAIFNADVTAFELNPPRSFSLVFSTGHRLTVHDDDPAYECFHIYPDGIHV